MFLVACPSWALRAPGRVKAAGLSSWKPLTRLLPVMGAEMVLYVLFTVDNDSQTPLPARPTYVQREKGTFVVF